jgi:sugar O-acyltransferase (sialic acid O-acetyltransferase NeuD family)
MVWPRRVLMAGTSRNPRYMADFIHETPGYEVVGLLEPQDETKVGSTLDGWPVYSLDDVPLEPEEHWVAVGVGRAILVEVTRRLEAGGFPLLTFVHPSAVVAKTVVLGEGTCVCPGAIVVGFSKLGRYTRIGPGAVIGHHVEIGDHVIVELAAAVAGAVTIGARSYVGMGAQLLDHVTVGSGSVVGAGAVVTRDVPDGVQVVGVPARVTKRLVDDGREG